MLNDDDRRLNNQAIKSITHYFTHPQNITIQYKQRSWWKYVS
jgi:hypothetical protein